MKLAVVTATIDYPRAKECIKGWWMHAAQTPATYIVGQGGFRPGWDKDHGVSPFGPMLNFYGSDEILGVVPAFQIGVKRALEDGHDLIACLHDDLEISEPGWDQRVRQLFTTCPRAGLAGFGGGKGLGSDNIYKVPYDPMQLARQDFISNMRDAERHGRRVTAPEPVACLDGFSQIGRREYWRGQNASYPQAGTDSLAGGNLYHILELADVVHHAYDAWLGAMAHQLGWEVWFLPVACHHHGGLTAVADPRYQEWANHFHLHDAMTGSEYQGDVAYWVKSHQVVYELCRHILPIRT